MSFLSFEKLTGISYQIKHLSDVLEKGCPIVCEGDKPWVTISTVEVTIRTGGARTRNMMHTGDLFPWKK
jgi:hypothetical protein